MALLSSVLLWSSCARHSSEALREAAHSLQSEWFRLELLGLPADTLLHIEGPHPYYQDELGYVYRLKAGEDSVEVWVEYYRDREGRIRAISLSYESPAFKVLTKLYQRWRTLLREACGASQGHAGHEVWESGEGRRLRLLLSPERRYLQVSVSLSAGEKPEGRHIPRNFGE